MSTIKDVARETGLSLATISKYINGGNVREVNRSRIEKAILELGYSVNRNARSLKTNRTMTIGVVMPTLCIPFFGDVLSALDRQLRKAGYTTFACSYDFDKDLELEKLRTLSNNNVDGVVLIAEDISGEEIQNIVNNGGRNTPVILVDRTIPDFVCDSVVIDNLNATYAAVEYLITGGHHRIGIIVAPQKISTAYERFTGYRRALKDYGIALDEALVQTGNNDFESGQRLFDVFMDMEDPPTAVCVTNYDMTVGAITAAHERGIVLGRDLGFFGFDAVDVSRIVSPQLSVVEQPTELMGRRAGELMLKRLGGELDTFPEVLRLKSTLHTFSKKDD